MTPRAGVPLDALLCALVLAPRAYARNRFFELFQLPEIRRTRRRASLVRGVIRQLVGERGRRGELIGEQVLDNGRVLLRYVIGDLSFTRTTALIPLEAALVRYALARAGRLPLREQDREAIDTALARLAPELPRPPL